MDNNKTLARAKEWLEGWLKRQHYIETYKSEIVAEFEAFVRNGEE